MFGAFLEEDTDRKVMRGKRVRSIAILITAA